jgi:hypothetical protein
MGEWSDLQVDTDNTQRLPLGFIDGDCKAQAERKLVAGYNPRELTGEGRQGNAWNTV